MSKKVNAKVIENAARRLGEEDKHTPLILASMAREGLDIAMKRYPEHRGRMVSLASVFQERQLLDVPGAGECYQVSSSGFLWTVTPPSGFGDFQLVSRAISPTHARFRISMTAYDVAVGWDDWNDQGPERDPIVVSKDPVLKVAVARAFCPVACVYIERSIRDRDGLSGYFVRHLRALCKNMTKVRYVLPGLSLNVRRSPHLQGEDTSKVMVNATFSATFELGIHSRETGGIVDSLHMRNSPVLFEIDASAQPDPKNTGGDHPQEGQDTNQNPSGVEIITIDDEGNPVEMQIEVKHPNKARRQVASSKCKEALSWWSSNTDLIKPTMSEIATRAIKAYGNPSMEDVDALVSLSEDTLHDIAQKRMSQYEEFDYDEAFMGLSQMLSSEIKTRLR